jgi:hypothetical protein
MFRREKTTPYTSLDCSERESEEEVLVGAAVNDVVPASMFRLCEVDQSAWNKSEQCRSYIHSDHTCNAKHKHPFNPPLATTSSSPSAGLRWKPCCLDQERTIRVDGEGGSE